MGALSNCSEQGLLSSCSGGLLIEVASLVVEHGLSLIAAGRGRSLLPRVGFSLRWLLLLWSTGFRHTGFSIAALRL